MKWLYGPRTAPPALAELAHGNGLRRFSRAPNPLPGYTMNLAEPLISTAPIGAYRHRELLAAFRRPRPGIPPRFPGTIRPRRSVCRVYMAHQRNVPLLYRKLVARRHVGSRDGLVHCAWMRAGDRQSLGTSMARQKKGRRLAREALRALFPSMADGQPGRCHPRRALRICELYVGSKSGRTLF